MKLGGYLASVDIHNQGYLRRMQIRKTKEYTKTSMWRPFWEFVSILQSCIKSIDWTTKHM